MKSILFFILTIASTTVNAQSLLVPSTKSFEKKWLKNANYQMTWCALKDTAQL